MKFYEDRDDQKFEVSGPFGKGLQVESEGVHIAFAAGTGALTFMDLVAQIALFNLGFGRNLGKESYANQLDFLDDGVKNNTLNYMHDSNSTENSEDF